MTDVSVRELRNHTAEVLRRVEAGERLVVTVDRRPVGRTHAAAQPSDLGPARTG